MFNLLFIFYPIRQRRKKFLHSRDKVSLHKKHTMKDIIWPIKNPKPIYRRRLATGDRPSVKKR